MPIHPLTQAASRSIVPHGQEARRDERDTGQDANEKGDRDAVNATIPEETHHLQR
jgi:hypothetical protein